MADRPRGAVAFLFTDVEGSPRLWQQHRAGIAAPTRPTAAVRLLGAADTLAEQAGYAPIPEARAERDALMAGIGDRLGQEDITPAWEAGRALSLDEAIDEAMALAEALASDPAGDP